jgi:hypothetical protein
MRMIDTVDPLSNTRVYPHGAARYPNVSQRLWSRASTREL